MSELEDKYYYKIKSLAADIEYILKAVKGTENGIIGLIPNENKRKIVREILAKVQSDTKTIQDTMGTPFHPEF